MGFATIDRTSAAYSEGRPSRGGNGTVASRLLRASSGNPAIIGVSNSPGAIVTTRIPNFESSRATGSVMPTTPALEALYAT